MWIQLLSQITDVTVDCASINLHIAIQTFEQFSTRDYFAGTPCQHKKQFRFSRGQLDDVAIETYGSVQGVESEVTDPYDDIAALFFA
jgi:hypothetical protein